jgi:hypothetical protein
MKLTNEQKVFLDKVVEGRWLINPNTDLVDVVDGGVYMSDMSLTEIPVKFGEVTSYFNCSYNQLTSLVGAPQSIGGGFYCSYNQLTSLVGAPQSIGGGFYCSYNQLTSLVGAPQSVGGDFDCRGSQLTSLEGAPQSVRGNFYCHGNRLTRLVGKPQLVKGLFFMNLGDIDKEYYHVIIPEIEEMIESGFGLHNPDLYYYPYKEAYYNSKVINVL